MLRGRSLSVHRLAYKFFTNTPTYFHKKAQAYILIFDFSTFRTLPYKIIIG